MSAIEDTATAHMVPTAEDSAPFTLVKMLDPRLQPQEKTIFAVEAGGSSVVTQGYSAASVSDSEITFNITTPGLTYGVHRVFIVEASFDVTCKADSGANVATTLGRIRGNSVGVRQFPIASVCSNQTLTLNGLSVSQQSQQLIHPLSTYVYEQSDREVSLACPHKPDPAYQYVASTTSPDLGAASGPCDPFSTFQSSDLEKSRRLGLWATVASSGGAVPNDIVRITVREPVQMSPLFFGLGSRPCLFNIGRLTLTLTLTNLLRALSGVPSIAGGGGSCWVRRGPVALDGDGVFQFDTANPASLSVSITPPSVKAPQLQLTYLTPRAEQVIPRSLVYPHFGVFDYVKPFSFADATQGSTQKVVFDSITLSALPKRIYIYAKPVRNTADALVGTPDFFTRITNISVNMMNVAGRLSTASEYDLFYMSARNGYKEGWLSWSRARGGVLCLEIGRDLLSASPALGAGVSGSFQFQFDITLAKVSEATDTQVLYELHTTTITPGLLRCDGEVYQSSIGSFTDVQLLAAPEKVAEPTVHDFYGGYAGGAWYNKLWDGIKKILPAGLRVASNLAPMAAMIPGVGAMAPMIGNVAGTLASSMGAGARKRLMRGGAVNMGSGDITARLSQF